jgi:hypothetical protein
VKLLLGETVTVAEPLAPGTTARVAGLTEIEKPGPSDASEPPPQEHNTAAMRGKARVLYGTFVTGMTKCQLLCPFFGRERKRRPRESSRHQFFHTHA